MRSKSGYRTAELLDEIRVLRNIFDSVEVIDPIKGRRIECGEHYFKVTSEDCRDICDVADREGDCICKKIVSTGETYNMFQFKEGETYYIISRPIKLRGKDFVMVISSKVTESLILGANNDSAELVKNITKYNKSIYCDELTGAYNRRFISENMEFVIKKAEQENINVCIGCIDIDEFKKFNDAYGHSFGDEVLKAVTEVIKSIARREDDYVVRLGGDEFVVIMKGLEKKRFIKMMQQCCNTIEDLRLKTDMGKTARINISIGTSSTIEDKLDTYEKLINMADMQLYVSKNKGKNCVT